MNEEVALCVSELRWKHKKSRWCSRVVGESVNEQIAQALKKSVMQLRVCLSRCVTALSVIAERQSAIVVLKNKN